MLEKINVTKGIHKPKTGINDCKWQVIAVPLNKSPAVSSRSQYCLQVSRAWKHNAAFLSRWTEGFCAPKTNSFSLLASLLSALPLSLALPTHTCSLSSVVLQSVLLCKQSDSQGIKAFPLWLILTQDDVCVTMNRFSHTSCLQCRAASDNHLPFCSVAVGVVGMAIPAPSWNPGWEANAVYYFQKIYKSLLPYSSVFIF